MKRTTKNQSIKSKIKPYAIKEIQNALQKENMNKKQNTFTNNKHINITGIPLASHKGQNQTQMDGKTPNIKNVSKNNSQSSLDLRSSSENMVSPTPSNGAISNNNENKGARKREASVSGDNSPSRTNLNAKKFYNTETINNIVIGNIPPNNADKRNIHDKKDDIAQGKEPQQFDKSATAPYIIYVQPSKESKNNIINACKFAKNVIKAFPESNALDEIVALSKNKMAIIINRKQIANELLKSNCWRDWEMIAFIPNHLLQCQGVIRISPDLSEEDIMENLIIPFPWEKNQVINIKRFSRRELNKETEQLEQIPTGTVQITFKGQTLPKKIYINKLAYDVKQYYPMVRQCYNCYYFGHIQSNCKAKKRCIRCGELNHITIDECTHKDSPPKCLHCQGSHLPTAKNCPKRIDEQKIRDLATERRATVSEIKREIFKNKNDGQNMRTNQSDFPNLSENPTRKEFNFTQSKENNMPLYSEKTKMSQTLFERFSQQEKHQNEYDEKRTYLGSRARTEKEDTLHQRKINDQKLRKQKDALKTISKLVEQQKLHREFLLFPDGRQNSYLAVGGKNGKSEPDKTQKDNITPEEQKQTEAQMNIHHAHIENLLETSAMEDILEAIMAVINKKNREFHQKYGYTQQRNTNHDYEPPNTQDDDIENASGMDLTYFTEDELA